MPPPPRWSQQQAKKVAILITALLALAVVSLSRRVTKAGVCPACHCPAHLDTANTNAELPQEQAAAAVTEVRQAQDAGGTGGGDGTPTFCSEPFTPPVAAVADALFTSTEDLERGIEEDFAPWANSGFTLQDLEATADALGIDSRHDTKLWVEVRNNSIVFPRRKGGTCNWDEGCNYMAGVQVDALNRGLQAGMLRIPEGLPMLWNVHDYPACWLDKEEGSSKCRAPVLSMITSQSYKDVLMPNFKPAYEPHFVPWQQKKGLAFFRGTPFCNPHPLRGVEFQHNTSCSRTRLANLSRDNPDLLDVSLNQDAKDGTKGAPGPAANMEAHAHYKYLLALDGFSASSRLASLLAINSLVLKQDSLYVEWYYRALLPCTHYLPIWRDSETDVLQVLEQLQASEANRLLAQRLAANAQAFAAAHLTDHARWSYWQRLIDRYAALYKGGKVHARALGPAARGRHKKQQAASAT